MCDRYVFCARGFFWEGSRVIYISILKNSIAFTHVHFLCISVPTDRFLTKVFFKKNFTSLQPSEKRRKHWKM